MTSRGIGRTGRGSLVMITGLFVGSALIRAGVGADQAWARNTTDLSDPGYASQSCEPAGDTDALLAALSEREKRVETHEAKLLNRAQALEVAGREIARKMEKLRAAEARLRQTLSMADDAAEGDISQLVKVYEAMKPKEAAALFEEMNPEFAAGFLGRMRPEFAAGVMANLSPQAAYTVSVVLAGRNADVPTR